MIRKLSNIIAAINIHPLASRHKLKAYVKLLSWQITQFISPGIKKIRFVGNTFLLVNKGMAGATGNIYCGLHEFSDMAFLLHFLREEDIFIDAGANIGSYTILASGVTKATTLCLEPAPSTYQYLLNNININCLQHNTELYNAAAGSTAGKIKFTTALDTVNHAVSENEDPDTAFVETEVVTIDSILKGRENARLIKIDTEGFETEVIAGMDLLLQNIGLKAIIIELNGSGGRYGFDENSIHEKLKIHEFAPYNYDPFYRKLKPMATFSDHNTIYIRDIDFVLERLRTSKRIEIFGESI